MRRLIARHAHMITVPGEVLNRERMLAALAMQESDGWRNRQPNFEPAYFSGTYADPERIEACTRKCDPVLLTGMAALSASSFGPWQVMYPVALELGFSGSPLELADPRTCLEFCIRYINVRVLPRIKDNPTREDLVRRIADGYNTGSPSDRIRNPKYETEVLAHYRDQDLFEKLVTLPVYFGDHRPANG